MHQPEVARLARLLLALVLVLPLLDAGRAMLVAGAFVTEFLAAPAWRPLTGWTETPTRQPMAVPGASVDRYGRPQGGGTPLVLVHGLAPDGKDDPRLADAAALLARTGFDVAVPTVPGLTRLRLRPGDREPVIATVVAHARPVVMVGVSVGAGVALLAAADDRIRDRVDFVLSLGGYASARALVRYYLTGEYGAGAEAGPEAEAGAGLRGHRTHDPALVQMFIDANADLLDGSTRDLVGGDPRDVARALDTLSPELARLFDALSPARSLPRVRAELAFVHGRTDVAVPFTESIALWHARPARARLVLVGVVGHVEAAPGTIAAGLRDVAALWSVVYALVSRA